MKLFVKILQNASTIVLAASFILAIFSFRKLSDVTRYLAIYILIAAAFELITTVLWYLSINNLPFVHLYTVFEFVVLSMYFSLLFKIVDFPQMHTIVKWILVLGIPLILVNSFFIQNLLFFNSYSRGMVAVIFVVYTALYFYCVVDKTEPQRNYVSWANAGILIYFAGSFSVFFLSNYTLLFERQQAKIIWAMHAFFFIVLCSCISLSIWQKAWRKI